MASVFSLTSAAVASAPTAVMPLAAPIATRPATGPATDFDTQVEQAWAGHTTILDLIRQADAWVLAGRPMLAAALYQAWLRVPRTTHDHLALFNLGVVLFTLGDWAGARDAYARALQRSPDFLQPRFNLGLVYEKLGQSDAAVAQWQSVVARTRTTEAEERPLHIMALNNLGRHCEDQRRYADASAALTQSLNLAPHQPDVIHHWVFLRAKQCLWPVYDPPRGLDEATLRRHTSALAMIALSDDPQEQLASARRFVDSRLHAVPTRLAPETPYGHARIRIGYCSSDFCQHPVAMLTAELFELHDRQAFELYAYDWSPEDGSALRQRIRNSFDHFVRIDGLDDAAAARLIREHEIDILIDLHGQTSGARPAMLAFRPAPVQITYLGLPATTGFPFIDHVIADRFLIPPELAHHYSEKPLYMPDIYQVSDRQRTVGPVPTRAACGLPPTGLVLCCMNNNYKINPEMFDVWMRILQQVPDAVLWLLADNPQSPVNLRREASLRGVDGGRLVFAERTGVPNYLARYALADLFLDTYPFNAGTTANDALWMGLPVLTRVGQTFASRMAGALLTAAGLPELITADASAYEQRAVELATQPERLLAMKHRLQQSRDNGPLFDIPRWVGHYESSLKSLLAAG
jgi:predicted O-linked N-acetylglucosamine transferase (SPINDLY family)